MMPRTISPILALLVLWVGVPTAAQQTQRADQDSATAQVMSLDREWLLGYNQRDAGPYNRIWAEDALLVTTQGGVRTKNEEREDVMRPVPPEVKAAWSVSEQRARRYGDTVIVIGKFSRNGTNNGEPFTRDYRYTNVYARLGDGWRLVTAQFAPVNPPRP